MSHGTRNGAPVTTGGIKGEIRDIRDATVIVDATIVVVGPDGSAATTSGEDGAFVLSDLAPGAYAAEAHADGYEPRAGMDLQVVAGILAPYDVRLRAVEDSDVGGPYRVVPVPIEMATPRDIEGILNAAANEGWELVTGLPPIMSPEPSSPAPGLLLVLRRAE